jgi:hypothetical protein
MHWGLSIKTRNSNLKFDNFLSPYIIPGPYRNEI